MNGQQIARSIKKNILGSYVRALEHLDPELSTRILGTQRELFLAGEAFFRNEATHAQRAIDKIKSRRERSVEPLD